MLRKLFLSTILIPSLFCLPLPRFVCLRASQANVHIGPATKYPITWILKRSGMPLKIIAEFDHWRQIQDIDGDIGWIHKSLLSGKLTVYITKDRIPLYSRAHPNSRILAYLQKGVIATVIKTDRTWYFIHVKHKSIGQYKGWVRSDSGFGPLTHN